MNFTLKLIAVLFVFLTFAACGGADTKEETKTVSPNNSAPVSNAETAAANTNTATMINPYPGISEADGNPANANTKVVNIDTKQIKQTNPAVPAADNSEFTSTLNEKGAVETRVFKSNPQLAKVERTTNGRDVKVRVFLKNGKVVELPADKVTNLVGDPADKFLLLAGIQPVKPSAASDDKTGAVTGAKTEDTKSTGDAQEKPNGAPTPNAPPASAPKKP